MKRAVLLSLFLVPTPAFGAGWSTVDQSVQAMATGGAGAANPNDPGANTYNAAAGMMAPGLSASLGIVLAAPSLSANGDGIDVSTSGLSTPPHVHARFTGEHFGVGASLTVPFGSNVEWPEDWAGRFVLRSARVRVLRTSAFVSGRFGNYAIAVGPHFDSGSLSLTRSIDFIDTEGSTSIETTASGVGLSAAIFARPFDALDVGLSYASRTKLGFDGYADFSAPPEFSGRVEDTPVTANVTLPDRFRLGARWRATDDLAVLADLELTLWNTFDALTFDFASEITDDVVQRRDWSTTVTPRAGVVWSALPYLDVRGGFYVDPTPVPSATVGPSSPDSTRIGLTAGAGLEIVEQVGLDLGYQLVVFTGSDAEADALPAVSYGGVVHVLGASLAARL